MKKLILVIKGISKINPPQAFLEEDKIKKKVITIKKIR